MGILGLGVLLAGWVVTIIYRLLAGDGTQEIIFNLIPMESIEVTIKTSSDILIAPDSFFYMVGLFFCVLLLAICGSIAKVLIANGVKMIQPDFEEAMAKFRKDLMEQKNRRR
ncbi:MAG: hypothetical protein OEZ57_00140 [Nitrospirota bacterium]|nr:hypothetical protein [Nitrospirota bacterium]